MSSLSPSSVTAGGAAFTLTVTGSNFVSSSVVEWNQSPRTTTWVNSTTLTIPVSAGDIAASGSADISVDNPAPGGGTSGSLSLKINSPQTSGITTVNLTANDLAWDPVHQQIYLSLPSADGANGNSIQVLNPQTGTLGATAFAGSEPNLVSVSANSQYLYVSLDGASNVIQMTLPNLAISNTIALGGDKFNGPYFAMDVQASPVADATVAVVRGTPEYSPEEEGGVVIYDSGVPRPDVLCGWIQFGCTSSTGPGLFDSIQWGANAAEIFAANSEDTAFDFYTIPVDASGFGTVTDYPGVVPGFFGSIHYDAATQLVYDDDGRSVDPANGTVVGTFNASGLMVPDGSLGIAYFVGQTQNQTSGSGYTIESFDLNHFTPIATLTIPNIAGVPTHLIRWGTDGLALTTASNGNSSSSGAVYLISGSFVTGASSSAIPAENVRRTWKRAILPPGKSGNLSRLGFSAAP